MKFYDENVNKKENEEPTEEIQNEDKENIKKESENEIKEETNNVSKKGNIKTKKATYVIISITIILVIALFLSTIFSLLNINNTKMMSGVSINEINIEGLTIEEAKSKITEVMQEKLDKDIIFKADNFEYSIKLSQFEVKYNIEETIKKAYDIGRNKNIFINNYSILKALVLGENINLDYTYNQELLDQILSDMSVKVPEAVINAAYYIEDDKLIITKGNPGNSIDKEVVKNKIINKIKDKDSDSINIEIIYVEPEDINIEKIYKEVHKEPKDAYYTKEPFQVFPHQNGVDFDLQAAKELLKVAKEEYQIQLIIKEPETTTNEIGDEAFPDILSTFSTKYDATNVSRTTNLKLAMNKLNGVVINPGQEFSYNNTLGKRTEAGGYKKAGGYAGGRVVPMLGGGICQISSTLYNAVIYANLEITKRYNHMFLTGYVGAGKDATVSYGTLDFKFKNTRKYPIMIKTTMSSGVAKIDIYGVKEEVEYEIEISTKILSYITYSVKYETDNSLAPGKEIVVQNGMNGAKSITYKIVKLNGVEISNTVLSTDTYDPMNKIIKRGPVVTKPEPSQDVNAAQQEKPVEDTNQGSIGQEETNNTANQEQNNTQNTIQNINENSTLNIIN